VVTYTGLSYFAVYDAQWGVLSFVLIPIVFACIHAQINLLLSRKEAVLFLLAHSLAPLLGSVAACVQMVLSAAGDNQKGARMGQFIALGSYLCHFLSWSYLVYLGLDLTNGLPARFTTVNYIDVLGMQKDDSTQQVSGRLSGLLSVASLKSNASQLEKEQPPMDKMVPAAASVRRADVMYQSLVQKKVEVSSSSTSGGMAEASAVPAATSTRLVRSKSEGQLGGVFATQVPEARGSVRLLNSHFAMKSVTKNASVFEQGPKDYAPTAAQLHSPDVLSRMPFLAYRLLGVTAAILWICGIFFGSVSLIPNVDIGWDNVISSPNATAVSDEAARRLLSEEGSYFAPVGRFFDVDEVACGVDGSIVVSDAASSRAFLRNREGSVTPCDTACSQLGVVSPPLVDRLDARTYEIVGPNKVAVTVPLVWAGNAGIAGFAVDTANGLIYGFDADHSDRLLSWSSQSGAFTGVVSVPCATHRVGPSDNPIAALCSNKNGNNVVVFRKGDSCRL
jgi:hypothetical protein